MSLLSFKTNLKIGLIGGPIGGFFVLIYLLLFPVDESEFQYYAYFKAPNGKYQETLLAENIEDMAQLEKYYYTLYDTLFTDAILEGSCRSTFHVPFDCKVKILDTIDDKIVRVNTIFINWRGNRTVKKGYLLLLNLQKEPR